MRTKQLIVTAALLIPGAIMAQEGRKVDPRAERGEARETRYDPQAAVDARLAEYKKAFDLNDEQVSQMREIFMQSEQDVMPLRMECERIQQSMQAKIEQSANRAETVLTAEQKNKLAELRKEGSFNDSAASCGMSAGKDGACCAASKANADRGRAQQQTEKPAPSPTRSATPAPGRR